MGCRGKEDVGTKGKGGEKGEEGKKGEWIHGQRGSPKGHLEEVKTFIIYQGCRVLTWLAAA